MLLTRINIIFATLIVSGKFDKELQSTVIMTPPVLRPGQRAPPQDPPRGPPDQAVQHEPGADLQGSGPQLRAGEGHQVAGP